MKNNKTYLNKFIKNGYVLIENAMSVKECEQIEDFWINPKYISPEQYADIVQLNHRGDRECPAQNFLSAKGYDWTHYYDKFDFEKLKGLY